METITRTVVSWADIMDKVDAGLLPNTCLKTDAALFRPGSWANQTTQIETIPEPEISTSQRKSEQKMTVAEFHTICEVEEKSTNVARKRRANKKKRKEKGWTSVQTKAKKESPDVTIRGPRIRGYRVPPAPGKGKFVNTTIILKNLPNDGTCQKALKKYFEFKCGNVRFVNVIQNTDGNAKGIAFIRFTSRNSSDKAFQLNGFRYNGREIQVEYALDNRE